MDENLHILKAHNKNKPYVEGSRHGRPPDDDYSSKTDPDTDLDSENWAD